MIVTVFQKLFSIGTKKWQTFAAVAVSCIEISKKGVLDPYKILVSELMLQQTQVDRVILKFTSFLKAFPTFDAPCQRLDQHAPF